MEKISKEKLKAILNYEKELAKKDALYLVIDIVHKLIDETSKNAEIFRKEYLETEWNQIN